MVGGLGIALLGLCAWAAAEEPAKTPAASGPVVEFRGTIQKVEVSRGQGMPYLELRQGDRTTRVRLGSMRYLMEQNFNPKAGSEVAVKGWRSGDEVIAMSVESGGKQLKLRDAGGRPVWMGGKGRRWCGNCP